LPFILANAAIPWYKNSRGRKQMTLQLILGLLTLVLLIFIAAELYIIARELARTRIALLKEFKTHETAQSGTSGQTINVNLGTVPAGNSSLTIPGTASAPPADAAADENENAEQDAQSKEIKSPDSDPSAIRVKATPVSLFAVKCPRCQAENSSYRSECYNCGEKL
jgi:Tfp pilus assembly protein PilN